MFGWKRKPKSLYKMSSTELSIQERILDRERNHLIQKLDEISKRKADVFYRGSEDKNPNVRKSLAQQFEVFTLEQTLIGREIVTRTKESMTIARLRVLRSFKYRNVPRISRKDMQKLGKMIDDHGISNEIYQQRLDKILNINCLGSEYESHVSEVEREVLEMWDRVDSGLVSDKQKAFGLVEKTVQGKIEEE